MAVNIPARVVPTKDEFVIPLCAFNGNCYRCSSRCSSTSPCSSCSLILSHANWTFRFSSNWHRLSCCLPHPLPELRIRCTPREYDAIWLTQGHLCFARSVTGPKAASDSRRNAFSFGQQFTRSEVESGAVADSLRTRSEGTATVGLARTHLERLASEKRGV